MQTSLAIIAFGANLGDREATFTRAVELLQLQVGPILKASKLLETAALVLPGEDPAQHPPYLNAVVLLQTWLGPSETLRELLEIERLLGRVREKRWAPRTVDLDLIAHGNAVLNSAELTLPHPEMHKRDFVIGPLMEIHPEWRHPVLGKSVRELWAGLKGLPYAAHSL